MTLLVMGLLVAAVALLWPSRGSSAPWGLSGRGVRSGEPRKARSAESRSAGTRNAQTTAGRTGWARRARRGGATDLAVAAEFAELLALCLSAGLGPDQAVDLAEGTQGPPDPRRTRLATMLRQPADGRPELVLGLPPPEAPPHGGNGRQAPRSLAPVARDGVADVRLLVLAWWMSRERGSPLTSAVASCARTLRSADAANRRRAAAEAGPKASMWVLSILPLVGPLIAALAGVDVRAAYGTPAAGVSCAVGLALTSAGWWWARRLLRSASRPVRHR